MNQAPCPVCRESVQTYADDRGVTRICLHAESDADFECPGSHRPPLHADADAISDGLNLLELAATPANETEVEMAAAAEDRRAVAA